MKDQKFNRPDLSSLVYGKVPPQAPELEQAVLGAVMLESDRLTEVLDILTDPACFYLDANQMIYGAICRLNERGYPVDLLTVTEELRNSGELELVGGPYYVTKLTMSVVSSAHVEAHARIVKEKFLLRELIRLGGRVVSEAYEEETDVFDLLDSVDEQIKSIDKGIGSDQTELVKNAANEVMEEIYALKNRTTVLTGVDTGLSEINKATNGWQKPNLIILAARPSQGKTALALHLALSAINSTIANPSPVLFFSLEMSNKELTRRLVAQIAEVDMEKIQNGQVDEYELSKLHEANRKLSQMKIHINDSNVNVNQIGYIARKKKKKHGIELIVIDYLQLVNVQNSKGKNREQVVSEVSRELKLMAKSLDVPVIALSQMNRDVEKGSRRPQLSDLRESGAIEQDADIVLFIHHEEEEGKRKNVLCIRKNRSGKCGDFEVRFLGAIQKWEDATPDFLPTHELFKPYAGMPGHRKDDFEDDTPF